MKRPTLFAATRSRGTLATDLGASALALAAVIGLLVVIDGRARDAGDGASQRAPVASERSEPRRPRVADITRDAPAEPAAGEEAIRAAMIQFALSKVAPERPESSAPVAATLIASDPAAAKKPVRTAAAPRAKAAPAPERAVLALGPAEWPQTASAPPAKSPSLMRSVFDGARERARAIAQGAWTTSANTLADGAELTRSGARSLGAGVSSLIDRLR